MRKLQMTAFELTLWPHITEIPANHKTAISRLKIKEKTTGQGIVISCDEFHHELTPEIIRTVLPLARQVKIVTDRKGVDVFCLLNKADLRLYKFSASLQNNALVFGLKTKSPIVFGGQAKPSLEDRIHKALCDFANNFSSMCSRRQQMIAEF